MTRKMICVGSITDLDEAAGALVVTGSHGGESVARHALGCGAGALIFHDAGIGRDDAGVAALRCFDRLGAPAVAIDHWSARIGDPQDMLERGLVSGTNEAAARLGVCPGMTAAQATTILDTLAPTRIEPGDADCCGITFRRREVAGSGRNPDGMSVRVVILDSASSAGPGDDGAILVTGSHGGLPANQAARAIKARPVLSVFNDAGIGIDRAGVRRLDALDAQGIAGICVAASSARIGDGESTYADGVVSTVNACAAALGLRVGSPLLNQLDALMSRLSSAATPRSTSNLGSPRS